MKSLLYVAVICTGLTFLCLTASAAVHAKATGSENNSKIRHSTNRAAASPAQTAENRVKDSALHQFTKQNHVVILLHGIGKGSMDMAAMSRGLRRAGFTVINWNYPSTKFNLSNLADQLNELVTSYDFKKVDFVTHSMGGIVVRTYLSKYHPKNVGRLVMIAPPNQGAQLADMLGDLMLYKMILGPAGQELRQGKAGDCVCAGTPTCEFGIIAGGTGNKIGFNPILPGDNDGTVTVESTRLCGASDFVLIPFMHPIIQMMPRTVRLTTHFLEYGKFSDGEAHPIIQEKTLAQGSAQDGQKLDSNK